MDPDQIMYQIYPLGFCGAPRHNDGKQAHRIRRVLQWIPHMKRLGITAVLFNPVFESDRHGYDTRDFSRIDCRLGTNEDFAEVCDGLHDAGISVILDAVYNHVGRGSPYFQDLLKNRKNSRYADWFCTDFSRTDEPDGFFYECWEGYRELAKLNLRSAEVRRFLISRTEQWIAEFGIDGLRLDVAYMLDRQFLQELCGKIRAYEPDFYFVGEMTGGNYRELTDGNLLTGVTNYDLRGALASFAVHGRLQETASAVNREFGQSGAYRHLPLLNFADNHDVDRIASLCPKERLPLIYDLLFALPGIPCIYYGSEWGTKGKRTKWSDAPLRPAFEKPLRNGLSEHIASLARMRSSYRIFTDGDLAVLYASDDVFMFRRRSAKGQLTFAVNASSHAAKMPADPEVGDAIDLFRLKKQHFSSSVMLEAKSSYFWYTDWI